MTESSKETAMVSMLAPLDSYVVQPILGEDHCEQLLAALPRVKIVNQETLERATDLDKMLATAIKKREDQRTQRVKPLNDIVSRINDRFKPLTARLKEGREELQDDHMKPYHRLVREQQEQQQLAAKKAQEDAALEAAQKLADQGKTEQAEQLIEQAADVPAPAPIQANLPVRGDFGGSSSFLENWKYEVTNLAEVPREYLMIDDRKIREAIKPKDGVRSVPGLRIWDDGRVRTT